MYGRIALVAGLVVGVVGVTSPTVSARPSAPSSQAPKRAAHFTPCPDVPGAQCGTIERSLDPLDPGGATITIGFELHRATNRNRPSLGTIVAVEGGPGYPSTGSRDFYLDLFAPLLARRDVLLVDARGTGLGSGQVGPGNRRRHSHRHLRPSRRLPAHSRMELQRGPPPGDDQRNHRRPASVTHTAGSLARHAVYPSMQVTESPVAPEIR